MEATDKIINSCAKFLFWRIHISLPGDMIDIKTNRVSYYSTLCNRYIDKFTTKNNEHISEIQEMYSYFERSDDHNVSSIEKYIEEFANNFTFYDKIDSEGIEAKLKKICAFIKMALLEYITHIKTKDTYMFLNSDMMGNADQNTKLVTKLAQFIRKNGAIYQYGAATQYMSTVPRALHDKLVKIAEKKGVKLY